MTVARFDGHYGRSLDIDVCSGCNGLWFDQMENHALTPGATLKLFREMGAAVAHAKRPLRANKACPRGGLELMPAVDKQRSTSFESFRCREGHGRYMTFTSFRRAKNFIRDLTPGEVHDLCRHVQTIKCTNCAAAVDITKESSCSCCRTPIAMLDPEQLAITISELEAAAQKRQTVDPLLPLRLAHGRLKAERVFAEMATKARAHVGGWTSLNLVDTGLSSIVHVLDALGYRD